MAKKMYGDMAQEAVNRKRLVEADTAFAAAMQKAKAQKAQAVKAQEDGNKP